MNKFNKSKIALLLALTSVFTGNKKSNASMVGNICDIATASSISASLAINNNNKSAAIAAVSLGFIGAIGIPVVAYFWNQKVERDKLANSIISSLKNKGKLADIKQSLKTSKNTLDETLKTSGIAFNEKEKEIEIVKFNTDFSQEEIKNKWITFHNEFQEISDKVKLIIKGNAKDNDEKTIKDFLGKLSNMPGVKFNSQLHLDEITKFLVLSFLFSILPSYQSVSSTLNDDTSFSKKCRNSDVPLRISVCKNKQEELSSVCSINFDITDWNSYDNKHNICLRISDKFELLIDGHSYDIDEMTKKK